MIDLRSDTVTKPTAEMRAAMAAAEVGDDVYGEDPTVNELQEEAARLLGCEAALWFPTGTMANATGLRVNATPGQEVLVDARAHVVRYELAGMAVLSGLMPRAVATADGLLTAEHVRAALSPPAYYKSDLGLVVLENTHNLAGGAVQELEDVRACVQAAHAAGLRVHIDGARLWNAATALGVEPRQLVAGADSVMVALSKGLCAPAGALLAGSSALIEQARRVRKQLGGGMRQVGVLAAAGLVALRRMLPRLAEDHAHARLLADALRACSGVKVAPVRTNIVVGVLATRGAPEVAGALRARGVLAAAMDAHTLRLVTHHDVTRADCEQAAQALSAVLTGA
jgi:threonine aldolase